MQFKKITIWYGDEIPDLHICADMVKEYKHMNFIFRSQIHAKMSERIDFVKMQAQKFLAYDCHVFVFANDYC